MESVGHLGAQLFPETVALFVGSLRRALPRERRAVVPSRSKGLLAPVSLVIFSIIRLLDLDSYVAEPKPSDRP